MGSNADDRFKGLTGDALYPVDSRFLPDGTDTRFSMPGVDGRFLSPGLDGRFVDPTQTDISISAKILVGNDSGANAARGYSSDWPDSDFSYRWLFPHIVRLNPSVAAARVSDFRDLGDDTLIFQFGTAGHSIIRSAWSVSFPGLGLSGTLSWSEGNQRFEGTVTGLHAALDAALGTEIDVDILVPAGVRPDPNAIITATVTPALGALTSGDQVQDGLAASATQTSNYASTEGTISSATASVTINGTAGALTDTVSTGDEVSVTITVTDSAANTRVFSAGTVTAAGIAPTVTATDSLSGDGLSISVSSTTGDPVPTTALTALTLDGVDVLADAIGAGPWGYVAPDSTASQVVAWEVTATNSAGSATATGSETVPANLFAPTASASIADQTFTVGEAVSLDVSSDFTGTEPITYALAPSSASLSPGLSLSSTGAISGTPTTVAAQVNIIIRGTNAYGSDDTAFGVTISAEADTTAPTITSFTYDDATDTATAEVNEDGTLYWVIDGSATAPANAQVKAGQGQDGAAADLSGSYAVIDGENTDTIDDSTLADGTWHIHVVAEDAAGNLSAVSTVSYTIDTTAPAFSSATLASDGVTMTVAFGEALDTANDTSTADWTVNVNGSAVSLSSAAIDTGTTTNVTVTLAAAALTGDTVTVSYSGTTLRDAAGNQVASFTGNSVTNNSTQSAAGPAVVSGSTGATVETGVTYDGKTGTRYTFPAGTGDITFSGSGEVYYLAVAGGGPGGYARYGPGGGGSGGDVLGGATTSKFTASAAIYDISVGAKGVAATDNTSGGTAGGNTDITLSGVTAISGPAVGGGRGGSHYGSSGPNYDPLDGGGGAGTAEDTYADTLFPGATHPTSYSGGDGATSPGSSGVDAERAGGGGRGAGGNGADGIRAVSGGAGGPGIASSISGASVTYGSGGDGQLANGYTDGDSATVPGCGGEGGKSEVNDIALGGDGADGIVILFVEDV